MLRHGRYPSLTPRTHTGDGVRHPLFFDMLSNVAAYTASGSCNVGT